MEWGTMVGYNIPWVWDTMGTGSMMTWDTTPLVIMLHWFILNLSTTT